MRRSVIAFALVLFIVSLPCAVLAADSYTPRLNLTKPSRGSANWDTKFNANSDKVDAAYGDIWSYMSDAPEVYYLTGTFNGTTGRTVTLPKSVNAITEYGVAVAATTRAGAIGDIYVEQGTSNFIVRCAEANTSDTFIATVYYKGVLNSYGNSQFRKWYVSVDAAVTDHGNAAQVGSLAWVLTQVGSNIVDVELPGNHTYAVGTAIDMISLAPNARLVFQNGAVLSGAVTVKIAHMQAGRHRIFTVPGGPTVSFEPGAVEHGYYPEWWGADPTGATDSGAALEEMIAAIKRGGVGSYGDTPYIQAPVSLAPKATYLCQRGLFPGQSPTDGVGVYGVEGHGARIIFENVAGSCKVAWDLTGKKFGYLHDVTFQGGIPNSDQFPVYSNPPEILVLMSRPYHVGGGANGHHWQNIQLRGAATVAGVYNYASEGWHVSDTTFWLASPAPVVITKSNFLGYTIPHEWGGAYAPLGSESCIEFLFERVNFFNTTLTGLSNPNTFCSLLVESASMTKIDHCEIGAAYVADIPLVRLVSGYVNAAFLINNFQITNTTFHPAPSVITLPILPSGNVTTGTDYKYGVYFQHGGAGTLASFRRVNLDQNTWNGSTSADIIAEENVRLYSFRTELTSGILDLSASGCGVYDDSSIWIGATATIHVDSELRGALYVNSGATVTFDNPAKVFAKIWVTDNGGALGSDATVTHDYGAAAAAYTLTAVDLAQLGTLRLTNASGAAACIVPAGVIKTFNVLNISGKTITIKYAGSTGVAVAHNKRAVLLADGAEIKEILAAY